MSPRELTDRDIETLGELEAASECGFKYPLNEMHKAGWVRPLDCGGYNGSHHSQTLAKLARRGLCDRHKFGGPRQKGSCRYRINADGRKLLAERKATYHSSKNDKETSHA